jgi:hypothetical protein
MVTTVQYARSSSHSPAHLSQVEHELRNEGKQVKVKVKVTLRLTVSQSVCLGVEPKYGTFDQSFFFF